MEREAYSAGVWIANLAPHQYYGRCNEVTSSTSWTSPPPPASIARICTSWLLMFVANKNSGGAAGMMHQKGRNVWVRSVVLEAGREKDADGGNGLSEGWVNKSPQRAKCPDRSSSKSLALRLAAARKRCQRSIGVAEQAEDETVPPPERKRARQFHYLITPKNSTFQTRLYLLRRRKAGTKGASSLG